MMVKDENVSANETKSAIIPVRKSRKTVMRKALHAPKRFKSSYILFFMQVQVKIKAELGGKVSAPTVSKKASEMWRALSTKDRRHWDDEAKKEKKRYTTEKAVYVGPWLVPHKRAKKDPSAPKRNPSAFLLFSQGKRQELRKLSPSTKNTEISCILGQLWRDLPPGEKRMYLDREIRERKLYTEAMEEWKKQQETTQLTGKISGTIPSCTSVNESQTAISDDNAAKWKKQKKIIQLTGKTSSTPSSPSGVVELVKFEDNVAVSAHDRDDDTHNSVLGSLQYHSISREIANFDSFGDDVTTQVCNRGGDTSSYHMYTSQDHNSSQGSFHASSFPPSIMQYDEDNHQGHPHPHSQEIYKNHQTQDVFISEPRQDLGRHCQSLTPQQCGDNYTNDEPRNPIPYHDEFEPLPLEPNILQQPGDYENNFRAPNNNNERQTHHYHDISHDRKAAHYWSCNENQQNWYQHDSQQNAEQYLS